MGHCYIIKGVPCSKLRFPLSLFKALSDLKLQDSEYISKIVPYGVLFPLPCHWRDGEHGLHVWKTS